jgi:two-component sensor histidine kinase
MVCDVSKADLDYLLSAQVRILESIARDSNLDSTLAEICRVAEAMVPGSKAGISILDRSGRTFESCVMPSMPAFAAAIAGVAADERFDAAWRKLSQEHGIRHLQSRPAVAADSRPLGSFFIGFAGDETAPASPEEVVAVAARLAGLAIERHLARERDRLVLRETQHRVKNLFASVLSLATQTAHSQPNLAEFLRAFESRVLALAAANDLLSADQPADLDVLVRRVVEPFASAAAVEVRGGPPFKVAEAAIVPFSLVLHELATNAAKYGALSRPGGTARIGWKAYRDEAGDRRFRFKWEESGGPQVTPPKRRGFGSFLVDRAFSDVEGNSRLTHAPDGVRYRFDAPMTSRLGWVEDATTPSADLAAL